MLSAGFPKNAHPVLLVFTDLSNRLTDKLILLSLLTP